MDTITQPLASIGIDIGKDVFHVVGLAARLVFVVRSSDWRSLRLSDGCLRGHARARRSRRKQTLTGLPDCRLQKEVRPGFDH
jgi:hypothetical protein